LLIVSATHACTHTLNSAVADILGTALVIVGGCAPWWLPYLAQIVWVGTEMMATQCGVDVKLMHERPAMWGMRENMAFAVLVLLLRLIATSILDCVAFVIGRNQVHTSDTTTSNLKGSIAWKLFYLGVQVLHARHVVEYTIGAEWGAAVDLGRVQWASQCTFLNTMAATVACFFLYDLFRYTLRRWCGDASRTGALHALDFVFAVYLHLLAIILVAISPLGIHVASVAAFCSISAILSLAVQYRLDISLPFFHGTSQHDAHLQNAQCNYGQYTMLWDFLCRTSE